MGNRLRIRLPGSFEVWRDDQIISAASRSEQKARQPLKALITYRDRAVASDELIEWLWPNLTPKSARNSLWVAISRGRRVPEPETTALGELTIRTLDSWQTNPATAPQSCSSYRQARPLSPRTLSSRGCAMKQNLAARDTLSPVLCLWREMAAEGQL